MKREIKFRGKCKVINKQICPENSWVYGYYYKDLSIDGTKNYIFNCPSTWEVLENSLGQFTGLIDKNGVEIYGGDIIKVNYKHDEISCTGGVKPDQDFYCDVFTVYHLASFALNLLRIEHKGSLDMHSLYTFSVFDLDGDDIEIIGNIYDNPELLNQ